MSIPHHPPPRAAFAILAATLALVACTASAVDPAPGTETATAGTATPTTTASPTAAPTATPEPEEETPAADATRFDGDAIVELQGSEFSETAIIIPVGTVVTFINRDGYTHTVTEGDHAAPAPDARFNAMLTGGQEVDIAFDEPGRYEVTCLPHSSMNMTVWVEG